ncbi:MAG: nitrilase-related carbon-nitrogen hydrolase, partial [Planctomycetota bacterium]
MLAALVETDTVWEDPEANRARVRSSLPRADVALFPELAFSGFTMEPAPDPAAEPFLRELARENSIALVAGYVGEGPTNVAVALDARGEVLARYAKLHPFTFAGEEERYRRGDALPLFDLLGFRAAMLICYDLRFPEAFREAALKGADLFLVIANWPEKRIAHWTTLLQARAIENQAYVLGVNRVGSDPNESYPGRSLAVDPLGAVLMEGQGVVELDPERPKWLRSKFPALRDTRTDRYRLTPSVLSENTAWIRSGPWTA